jgi:hypothetical protein
MSPEAKPASTADLIKSIRNDILKSGFPLEVHVLNVCSTRNTGRMPGIRYEYLDQLREIDLLAFFETINVDRKKHTTFQHTITDLIIECKKSTDKPWVFFSSSSYAFENVASFLKYTSDFDLYFSQSKLPPLIAQVYPRIRRSHYADAALPRCVSYYEAFKGTSSPSEIYRAIDSVITYLCYRRGSRLKNREEFGVVSEFYLPIIVLDGRLFEASLDNPEIEVRERSHLQLRTFHRNHLYIIDIVTKDHFQEFFLGVEAFHEEVCDAIKRLNFSPVFEGAVRQKAVHDRKALDDPEGLIAMSMADIKRRAAQRKSSARRRASESRSRRRVSA